MKKKKVKFSSKDFTESSLPSTRRQQFFHILKNEWRTIVGLSFIGLLFALPYILCIVLEMTMSNAASIAYNALTEAEKSKVNLDAQLTNIHRLFGGINIISFAIFGLFIAGAIRIIRKFCLDEVVLAKHDFFEGIKMYWKSFFFCFLINGFFLFMIDYISSTLGSVSSSALSNGIRGLIMGIYFAIIIPLSLNNLSQNTFYTLSFFKRTRNSFRFSIVRFYMLFPFLIVLFGFYFITLIPSFLISIILSILCIILIPVLYSLAFYLYSIYLFDKYVNKDNYPEIYRKGLSSKKEE